jgi:hypothetical protein
LIAFGYFSSEPCFWSRCFQYSIDSQLVENGVPFDFISPPISLCLGLPNEEGVMVALKLVALAIALPMTTMACSQGSVSFKRDVNPIFQENCAVCHTPGGPGFQKSGFSVMSYQDIMKGTKYGRVINPGSSVGSTLVRLIKHQADTSINMPKEYTISLKSHMDVITPGSSARSLSDSEIDLVSKWVDQGAKNN